MSQYSAKKSGTIVREIFLDFRKGSVNDKLGWIIIFLGWFIAPLIGIIIPIISTTVDVLSK